MQYQCPVCSSKVENDLVVYTEHIDKHIVDLVKHDHPEWIENSGMCKKCYEYYKAEIQGSIFKDAPCALRIRKTKSVFEKFRQLFVRT